ncbi:hypothetical protein MtrunA17_Chr5g0420681 [Medicago truncatula]|uniref:Uncharacterized protein n=1 Tax=Medicago truncatula TaxID=3880 RepID=A0A396HT53_MEDTR|nr:hypothetical protein MtrunA17_Chr5g0420681 [Medicago truncatula]
MNSCRIQRPRIIEGLVFFRRHEDSTHIEIYYKVTVELSEFLQNSIQ